jgi:hypothetical protein
MVYYFQVPSSPSSFLLRVPRQRAGDGRLTAGLLKDTNVRKLQDTRAKDFRFLRIQVLLCAWILNLGAKRDTLNSRCEPGMPTLC